MDVNLVYILLTLYGNAFYDPTSAAYLHWPVSSLVHDVGEAVNIAWACSLIRWKVELPCFSATKSWGNHNTALSLLFIHAERIYLVTHEYAGSVFILLSLGHTFEILSLKQQN